MPYAVEQINDHTLQVEISIEEWEEMENDLAFLSALKAAGVDNWDGYDLAYDILKEWGYSNDD